MASERKRERSRLILKTDSSPFVLVSFSISIFDLCSLSFLRRGCEDRPGKVLRVAYTYASGIVTVSFDWLAGHAVGRSKYLPLSRRDVMSECSGVFSAIELSSERSRFTKNGLLDG